MPKSNQEQQPAQQHHREYYGVRALLASHPAMRRLKKGAKTRFHGNKNWAASYLLMESLERLPLASGSRVLEVGCGWGLASIYCARQFAAEVTASDIDPAVAPYLELHAAENQVQLNWQQAAFLDFDAAALSPYQVLIASDICFWDDMADDVFSLISTAIAAGVERIMIADPLRPPFLDLAERCVDAFYGELLPVNAQSRRQHHGGLLLIENA